MEDIIRFRCPTCSKKLSIKASRAGASVRCPACDEALTVPEGQTRELEELRYKLEVAEKEAAKLTNAEVALAKAKEGLAKIDQLESDLQAEQARTKSLGRDLEKTRSELESLSSTRASEESRLAVLRAKLNTEEDSVKALSSKAASSSALKSELKESEQANLKLKKTCDELSRQKKEAEAKLGQLQADLKKQANGKSEQISLVREQVKSLTSERDALKAKLHALEKEEAKTNVSETAAQKVLQKKLDAAKAEKESLAKQLDEAKKSAKADRYTWQKDLDAVKASQSSAEEQSAKLSALQSELNQAKAAHKEVVEEMGGMVTAAAFAELQTRFTEMEVELGSARRRAREMVEPDRLAKVETVRDELQTKVVAAEAEVSRTRSELEALRANITEQEAEAERIRTELEERVQSLDNDSLQTYSELETTRQLHETLKLDHEALAEKFAATTKDLEKRTGDADAARQQQAELEKARDAAEAAQREKGSRVKELEEELKRRDEAVANAGQASSKLKAEIDALKKRLAEQAEELENLRNLPNTLDKLRAEADAANAKASNMQTQLAEFEHGRTQVEEERQRQNTRAEKLEQRLQEALEEKTTLKSTCTDLAHKARHLKQEFEEYRGIYNEKSQKGATRDDREKVRQLAEETRQKVVDVSHRLKTVLGQKDAMEIRLSEQIERNQSIEQERNVLRQEVKVLTQKITQKSVEVGELLQRFKKKGSPKELLAAKKQVIKLQAQLEDVNMDLREKRSQLAELKATTQQLS